MAVKTLVTQVQPLSQWKNNFLFLYRIESVVRTGAVAHACNTSTWEVKTGKSGIQELQLCSNFKAIKTPSHIPIHTHQSGNHG